MNRIGSACLALAILSIGVARAEYRWEQHLFGSNIQDLAYRDGALYWGTTAGLVRMDLADTTFTVERREPGGLPSDSIDVVTFDSDGNLWCGTPSEAIAVLRANGRWERVRTFDGLPDARILTLESSGGKVFVGTGAGFATAELDDEGDPAFSGVCTVLDPCADVLPSLSIQAYLRYVEGDTAEVIWYGTASGPARFDRRDPVDPWLVPTLGLGNETSVRALFRYQGEVWVGTEAGAFRFDPVGAGWLATTGTDGNVVAFVEHEGELLCASPGQTARVHRWTGTAWQNLGTTFSGSARPQSFAHDGDGRLWCGTTGGLRALTGSGSWTAAIQVDGLPVDGPTWTVATGPDGRSWLGFRNRSAAAGNDGSGWRLIDATTTGGNFEARPVQLVFVDHRGRIWLGHCCCTGAGECLADRSRDPFSTDPGDWLRLGAQNLRTIAHDGGNRFFMGSGNEDPAVIGAGIYLWEEGVSGDEVELLTTADVSLSSNTIPSLAFDNQGRLWVGHRQLGVDVWEYGADPRVPGDDFWIRLREDSPVPGRQLPSNDVLALAADGDRMWVGTVRGVALFVNGTLNGAWGAIELGNPLVKSIAVSGDRSAWAATPDGVIRFKPTSLGDYSLERYRFPDLTSDEITRVIASGTTVWVATERGAVRGTPAPTGPGPSGSSEGSAYPNPFIPARQDGVRLTDVTVPVSGSVHDAAGMVVARFREVGPGEIVWNGRMGDDQSGNLAAPGIYAIVARSDNLTLTVRVALVR